MCGMQALVVSVACVVDCRRSSCRSVSLAVKGWRCQVNEKIVGTRSNAQCPRAMHVCGGADWCSPMSTSFLGRVGSLMSKVGWRVDRYHHDKGESQMDHIDRRDDFQELVCIENSLLVRFGVLPSLIGIAWVRR